MPRVSWLAINETTLFLVMTASAHSYRIQRKEAGVRQQGRYSFPPTSTQSPQIQPTGMSPSARLLLVEVDV